jgi:hypothetical protein
MFLRLLSFQWKTAVRSPMWNKNLVLNLVIGFFLLLFGFYILVLGLFMDKILEEIFPGSNIYDKFNGLLLYYFLADVFMRFMVQGLPKLTIESFLHLPLKKNQVVNFMVSRTIFDIMNLIPLLVFIPVTFTIAVPQLGSSGGALWLAGMVFMVLANSFLATYLKRMMGSKPMIVAAVGVFFVGLIILEKFNIISLSALSTKIFGFLYARPILLPLPAIWMLLTYYLHFRFLRIHLYPEEMQQRKAYEVQAGKENQLLKGLGLTGSIIMVEWKLYSRNKRTKTILYMTPIFLLYGLMFYPKPEYINQYGFLMFVGVFMTGGMMLNYANYAFGYESAYFDALLTKNIDFHQYIKVKYYISLLISIICFILTIPYLYFGMKVLLINSAMFLYNIGILSYVLLYFATYNKKRIDLSRGGAFNYQGMGATNWLAILPAFLLPILIFLPFKYSGKPEWGIAFIGIVGIIGLFFSKSIIGLIFKNFYKRKYVMASSFRERG